MAGPGSVYSFWKTVQTVSPRSIEDEAAASFKLAMVGRPEDREHLRKLLLTDRATEIEIEDSATYMRGFDSPPEMDTAAAFSFIMYVGGPDEPIGVRAHNGMPISGTIGEVFQGMLTLRPDLTLAFARRLPYFRVPACNRLIQQTSKVNASLAIISALPGVIPLSAIFLPVMSVADVIMLTKNQIMLVMRLAAAFGRKPGYRQTGELIGTIGCALGWRQAARELVGLVPLGIGLALKASIAFSGTMAVGKAAMLFYQSGKRPTPDVIIEAYDASQAEAKQTAEELAEAALNPQAAADDAL